MQSLSSPAFLRITRNKRGVSLIEMTIVVIVVALAAAAVFVGSSLLQQAAQRRIMATKEGLASSIGLFQSRYLALPGDFANYDGLITGINGGNQNGIIGYLPAAATGKWDEVNNIYAHLSAAHMVEASYSAADIGRTSGPYVWVPGTNAPMGPIANSVFWLGAHDSNLYGRTALQDNLILLTGADARAGAMTLEQAISLDDKFDDGKAATGMIRAYRPWDGVGGGNDCVSDVRTAAAAEYRDLDTISASSTGDCVVEVGAF